MKKLMVLFVLLGSFSTFGQQYDVYVEYRYVGGISPYNAKVHVGVNSAITFNQYFRSPYFPPSAFTRGDILATSTTSTSLDWNASLNFESISGSENGTVHLGLGGQSYFNISGQGYSWSGSITLVDSIIVTSPDEQICYKDKINIQATPGHPSEAYRWTYKVLGSEETEKPLFGNFSTQNVSLEDLYPNNPEQYIETPILFTVYNDLVGYSSTTNYYWLGCSVERDGDPTPTDATCFGNTDGSVTIKFKGDVENGYEMRYFIYEGNPSLFPIDRLKDEEQPLIQGLQSVASPRLNLNSNLEGIYLGLGTSVIGYFIVYQEVNYNVDPPKIKSGGITPQFRINEPSQIIPSASITQALCDQNDATIEFSATGGNSLDASGTYSYQYELNGNGNWITATANPQTVQLTDSDQTVQIKAIYTTGNNEGCESDTEVLMDKIDAIVPPLSFTNPSPGTTSSDSSTDGVIRINYGGGTPEYTFQLAKLNEISSVFEDVSNPNIILLSPKVEFRDLGVGTYRITITDKDGTGCTLSGPDISVSSAPLPVLGLEEIEQISCPGAVDGTITVHISGGMLDYNYQWTINNVVSPFGTTGSATISMSNITEPGEYILKVASRGFIDFNDPSGYVTTTINLKTPEEVIIQNVTVNNISCNGAQDGSITIAPSGGTTYQYKLDFFDSWTDLNANTIPIISGGFYDIYLRNGNGCEATPLLDLLVEEPDELVITDILSTNLSAVDNKDGAIDITLEGGNLPYSYQWTGPNGLVFDTEDIVGLAQGDYQVTITDANSCTVSSTTITIIDTSSLLVILNQTVLLECYGDDFAELTANAVGGTSPYTYEWFQSKNGINTQLLDDSTILGNLTVGTYFVRATDANGMSAASTINITQPDLLSIVVDNTTDVACNGYDTGAIDVSVTGGTAPYDYLWSNGAISQDLTNIPSGIYFLEVLDDNGCRTEVEITLGSPANALKITNESIKNVSEYQGNDGSISMELTGGASPYTITWTKIENGQKIGNDLLISNLSVGNYEVFITDAHGCSLGMTYEIEQPDIVNETIVPISCAGQNDGSITILVNQGDGVFDYTWNTGATTNTISNLGAGSYSVTITGLGDTPITRTYVIDEPLALTVDLGGDKTLCAGQVLELDATVEGALATYSWTSDTGFISSKPKINITTTGNYSVTVSNPTGCSTTGSIFVDISTEEISAEFAVSSQVFAGETLVAVDISYPLPEIVEWIIPENASVKAQNEDELELLFTEPGEYEIGILTKRGLCEATQIKKVLVLEKDPTFAGKNDKHSRKKVDDFIIYPNPTNGKFSTDISMNEVGEISLKIFSFANNTMIDHKKGKGKKSYSIPFDLSGTPSGVYAVLLETHYGNALRKVVIK